MANKIFRQRSIEYQMKLDRGFLAGKAKRAAGDAALCSKVQLVLLGLVKSFHGASPKYETPWQRLGIRYDTEPNKAPGLFRQNNISLAIEASDSLTKFKCKQHSFIAELLAIKPGAALCYPKNKGRDVKFKLEQDIHFNNTKFCASGSLFLKGEHTRTATVRDFSRLFPAIERIAACETLLYPVSQWQETVLEFSTQWPAGELGWMLVNRWEGDTLIESELSYKLAKAMKDEWNRELLELANRLYLELQKNPLFLKDPPVFYYQDPVASVSVRRVP